MAVRMGPVVHIPINENATGSNIVVPAPAAGLVVLIINYMFICNAAVIVTWEDDGGQDIVGPLSFAANGGVSCPDSNVGWGRTRSGRGLNLRLSANVIVGGGLAYRLAPDHF